MSWWGPGVEGSTAPVVTDALPSDNAFLDTAYVALGSNQGDRAKLLGEAVVRLEATVGVDAVTCSPLYQTPAVSLGGVGDADAADAYLNAVALLRTTLEPRALLERLLEIEGELGRVPRGQRAKWADRPIDLDLVLFGDLVIDEPGLTVPHPRLAERWFVLRPLCDLDPDALHPVTGRSAAAMLEAVEGAGNPVAGFGFAFPTDPTEAEQD